MDAAEINNSFQTLKFVAASILFAFCGGVSITIGCFTFSYKDVLSAVPYVIVGELLMVGSVFFGNKLRDEADRFRSMIPPQKVIGRQSISEIDREETCISLPQDEATPNGEDNKLCAVIAAIMQQDREPEETGPMCLTLILDEAAESQESEQGQEQRLLCCFCSQEAPRSELWELTSKHRFSKDLSYRVTIYSHCHCFKEHLHRSVWNTFGGLFVGEHGKALDS